MSSLSKLNLPTPCNQNPSNLSREWLFKGINLRITNKLNQMKFIYAFVILALIAISANALRSSNYFWNPQTIEQCTQNVIAGIIQSGYKKNWVELMPASYRASHIHICIPRHGTHFTDLIKALERSINLQ